MRDKKTKEKGDISRDWEREKKKLFYFKKHFNHINIIMPYKKEFERHIIFKNFKVETELRSKISQNSPMFKRKKILKLIENIFVI